MKLRLFLVVLILFSMLYLASAEVTVGYSFADPSQKVVIDIPEYQQNQSLVTVNNSIYWNGNLWSDTRWLNIDGSNANQNIDISNYNFTTSGTISAGYLIGDGSQITNINTSAINFSQIYPHDQELNTTSNVTFDYVVVTNNITAKNGTFEYLNVTEDLYVKNSTIYLGNVSISSYEYPSGKKVVTFGDSFVNATGYFGDGGFLDNISFVNGSVIALAFNGTEFFGGNFSGDNFTGSNAFFDYYNWLAEYPFLEFNGSLLRFNETALQDFLDAQYDQDLNTTSSVEFANVTSNFSGTYDWIAEWPYLIFNGTYLYFNRTPLNEYYIKTSGYNYLNGTLNVTNIYAQNLEAEFASITNLTAEQIYAINIVADTVTAVNITTEDLSAGTIFTRNFTVNGTPTGLCLSNGTGCLTPNIFDQILNSTSGVEFANVTSNFFGTYDWTAEFPWLNFNGTYLTFNDTHLDNYVGTLVNQSIGNYTFENVTVENINITGSVTLNDSTITDWSTFEVNEYEEVILINTSVGPSNQSSSLLNFEITQIIVEPTTPNNKYRFEAVESTDGSIIDRDRQVHVGEWNIYKSHIINDKVNVSVTNAGTDEVFSVTIKYLDNYR